MSKKTKRSLKGPQRTVLLHWGQFKRDFPWRHNISPYRVMVAEFMLQRTRAKQAAPVFKEFVARFPSIHILARANNKEVSKYTKHLGIHWRVRHFIESSRFVAKVYSGRIPSQREKLLAIPGVGQYVAGAILTVGFQKPEWVIDSNIARFFNRFLALRLKGELRRKASVVSAAKAFFNFQDTRNLLFSLLDFTALICVPGKPRCTKCMLKKYCRYTHKTT